MARHPGWVHSFASEADLEVVKDAIAIAEAGTSAEIRVHLERRCGDDPMAQAVAAFERLGMHRTAERHGVLIYIAIEDRKLAVIGDQGIHERVGEAYWQGVVNAVITHFRMERPRDGMVHAVTELGAALGQNFPRRPDDVDELPNEVSIA